MYSLVTLQISAFVGFIRNAWVSVYQYVVDKQTRRRHVRYRFSIHSRSVPGLRRRTCDVIRDNPAAAATADTTLSDKRVSGIGYDWSSLCSVLV